MEKKKIVNVTTSGSRKKNLKIARHRENVVRVCFDKTAHGQWRESATAVAHDDYDGSVEVPRVLMELVASLRDLREMGDGSGVAPNAKRKAY